MKNLWEVFECQTEYLGSWLFCSLNELCASAMDLREAEQINGLLVNKLDLQKVIIL